MSEKAGRDVAVETWGGEPLWFVIRTNRSQERLAIAALKEDHVEAYLPIIVRMGRRGAAGYGASAVPMFQSYCFARLPLVSDLWRKVFTARGVNMVLTRHGKVAPLPTLVIDEIKRREHEGFVRMSLDADPVHRFEKGQLVMLKKGRKGGEVEAIFHEPIDARRCWILISLLGEARLAKADVHSLEPKAA